MIDSEVLRSIPSEYIRPDMRCPQVDTDGLNWNREQCILRLAVGNPCTYRCRIAKDICKERGWELPTGAHRKAHFKSAPVHRKKHLRSKRSNPSKYTGEAWKRYLSHEKKWGQKELWERNRAMFFDVIEGMTTKELASTYRLSRPRSSQIVMVLCKAVYPGLFEELFGDGSGGIRFSIIKIRKNGGEFAKRMPVEYPEFKE